MLSWAPTSSGDFPQAIRNLGAAFDVPVVDTTAAGDAFTAAMVLEYLESGGDIVLSAKYGAAAGAVAISRSGAASSVPSSSEIMDFIKRIPE